MKTIKRFLLVFFLLFFFLHFSNSQEKSSTGWTYVADEGGGFEYVKYSDPKKIPKNASRYFEGIKLVEGGTFRSGNTSNLMYTEKDSTLLVNSILRNITVSSFYISDHEVTNAEYREFTNWLKGYFARYILAEKYPEYYVKGTKKLNKNTPIKWNDDALFGTLYLKEKDSLGKPVLNSKVLISPFPSIDDIKAGKNMTGDKVVSLYPDTLCWTNEFSYFNTEIMSDYYYRHPAYDNSPVVGVSWQAANAYCLWRTDRLNEAILIGNGIDPGEGYFNTDEFLAENYEGNAASTNSEKKIKIADGLLYPRFRLPTEMEWEYAAQGITQEKDESSHIGRYRLFPWENNILTDKSGNYRANFGPIYDQNGLMLKSWDDFSVDNKKELLNYVYTAPVKKFPPNGFKLYDMGGNVAEWVLDVPVLLQRDTEIGELRPFRNQDSIYRRPVDSVELSVTVLPDDDLQVAKQKVLNYIKIYMPYQYEYYVKDVEEGGKRLEEVAIISLHNAKVLDAQSPARIVKGGSWATGPAYMQCSAREAFNENKGSTRIGFRVAMIRVGSLVIDETK